MHNDPINQHKQLTRHGPSGPPRHNVKKGLRLTPLYRLHPPPSTHTDEHTHTHTHTQTHTPTHTLLHTHMLSRSDPSPVHVVAVRGHGHHPLVEQAGEAGAGDAGAGCSRHQGGHGGHRGRQGIARVHGHKEGRDARPSHQLVAEEPDGLHGDSDGRERGQGPGGGGVVVRNKTKTLARTHHRQDEDTCTRTPRRRASEDTTGQDEWRCRAL